MFREVCRAKLHRLIVTGAELLYDGSLTLDPELMEAAGIGPWEKVQVLNYHTGDRLQTDVMRGVAGSGAVALNGPAARLGRVGDAVTVIAYALVDDGAARDWRPTIVFADEHNRVTAVKSVSADQMVV